MIKHKSMTAMVIISALLFSMTIAATNMPETSTRMENPLNEAGTQSGGLSLSSLNALLEGGNSALTADTLPNAAGIIQYCITNKLSDPHPADDIHLQLMRRLYQQPARYGSQLEGYLQGKNGLLNTFSGQQLDMSKLGNTHLAQQMKMSACDLILRQGKFYTL